jgi:hypothetical protein
MARMQVKRILQRRRLYTAGIKQIPIIANSAAWSENDGSLVPCFVEAANELRAAVVTVRVTGTVVVEEVNATALGLKLQELWGGKPEQVDDDNVAEPVNPFCAANVSTVLPDPPGLAILICVGLAVIVKFSPTAIKVAVEVDPM